MKQQYIILLLIPDMISVNPKVKKNILFCGDLKTFFVTIYYTQSVKTVHTNRCKQSCDMGRRGLMPVPTFPAAMTLHRRVSHLHVARSLTLSQVVEQLINGCVGQPDERRCRTQRHLSTHTYRD